MNPPNHPTTEPVRIPDLLDEQTATDVQRSKERILDRAQTFFATSPDDSVFAEMLRANLNAIKMAAEIRDYLECVGNNLDRSGSERSTAYVRRLADYARQLETQALLETESLSG